MGFLLQTRMSWLRALFEGCRCWCCGPGCWCCELAERSFETGRGAGRVLVSADCARCRKLAAQAAYILVPASRMSTGRGILPSYLGLCWCNLLLFYCFSPDSEAMGSWLCSWCCELAVRVVETGCWRRCWCWVPGAGAVSAGETGCWWWWWCCELALHVVGAGCARFRRCWVPVPGAGVGCGAGAGCGNRMPLLGAGAGCWCWRHGAGWWRQRAPVPAL